MAQNAQGAVPFSGDSPPTTNNAPGGKFPFMASPPSPMGKVGVDLNFAAAAPSVMPTPRRPEVSITAEEAQLT